MNKIVILIITLLVSDCGPMKAQSFEIPIHFEDSAGNRDTIILGYDISASYAIDPAFGEIDLLDSAYTDDFEVRAALYDYGFAHGDLTRNLESKKMIIGYVCHDSTYFDEANSFMVVMKTNHWPINISWDKSLFLESCNKLRIIDCTAGAWFDVCGGGHPYLLLEMNQSDTASYYDTEFKIETGEDTLSVLFFSFFNDFGSNVSTVLNTRELVLTPNPTNCSLFLEYPLTFDDKINITDIMGKSISFSYFNQNIDLSDAPDGLYILTVKLKTGELFVTKIIKQRR